MCIDVFGYIPSYTETSGCVTSTVLIGSQDPWFLWQICTDLSDYTLKWRVLLVLRSGRLHYLASSEGIHTSVKVVFPALLSVNNLMSIFRIVWLNFSTRPFAYARWITMITFVSVCIIKSHISIPVNTWIWQCWTEITRGGIIRQWSIPIIFTSSLSRLLLNSPHH